MNTQNAQKLLTTAARLVELTATFKAQYGQDYGAGMPDEAWKLYQAILHHQAQIARMLDAHVHRIEALHHPHGEWWKRRDVMNTATAQAVVEQASHLIACCARISVRQAEDDKIDWSYAIHATQVVIAGMLHPASLQLAQDDTIALSV